MILDWMFQTAGSAELLARLFFLLGHIAIKVLVALEEAETRCSFPSPHEHFSFSSDDFHIFITIVIIIIIVITIIFSTLLVFKVFYVFLNLVWGFQL